MSHPLRAAWTILSILERDPNAEFRGAVRTLLAQSVYVTASSECFMFP